VVFCVLGMLGAVETAFLRKRKAWNLRRLAPLIAAFFIAVMVGLGENADVKAHFFGFAIGAALGFLSRWLPRRLGRPQWQVVSALVTYGVYALAWWRAYES
jgi:membrane associated rhomboid family serine protease